VPSGGQPGISRADDDNVDAPWKFWLGTGDWGLGTPAAKRRDGIPPVWVFVHRPVFFGEMEADAPIAATRTDDIQCT